jgi:DNA mismatch endonuclease (patch repair protein)
MADIFTKSKRSFVMSRIRSRGNKDTEVALAKLFRKHKITGWRRQVQIGGGARSPRRAGRLSAKRGAHGVTRPTLRVRPDFIFPRLKLAIFVDGCFWHGCPRHGTQPKGNRAFWKRKFARNLARDTLVNRTLRRSGWRVLRVWEHELARKHEARLLTRIQRALTPAR